MHFKHLLTIVASVFLLFSAQTCKQSTPPPQQDEVPNPGKRDYTWTIDTLYYQRGGQTLIQDIWGSSPTNVYAVGHDAAAGVATMWHFDGKAWKHVGLSNIDAGPISGLFDLSAIYGFDSTDIYAVGSRVYQTGSDKPPHFLDSSLIIHFDGVTWREIGMQRYGALSTIHGSSPRDIWCGGTNYSLYHFDGVSWISNPLSNLFPPFFDSGIHDILVNNTEVFLLTYGWRATDGAMKYKILRGGENQFSVTDSFTIGEGQFEYKWGTSKLWVTPSGRLYSCGGGGVYLYNGRLWDKVFSSSKWVENIFGFGDDDIFAVGDFGGVYHYNGTDWRQLTVPGSSFWLFRRIWCTQNEVFIAANDGDVTYMLHGK
jgi:hypothetical protein